MINWNHVLDLLPVILIKFSYWWLMSCRLWMEFFSYHRFSRNDIPKLPVAPDASWQQLLTAIFKEPLNKLACAHRFFLLSQLLWEVFETGLNLWALNWSILERVQSADIFLLLRRARFRGHSRSKKISACVVASIALWKIRIRSKKMSKTRVYCGAHSTTIST